MAGDISEGIETNPIMIVGKWSIAAVVFAIVFIFLGISSIDSDKDPTIQGVLYILVAITALPIGFYYQVDQSVERMPQIATDIALISSAGLAIFFSLAFIIGLVNNK